jgi:hypothetical protein
MSSELYEHLERHLLPVIEAMADPHEYQKTPGPMAGNAAVSIAMTV